MSSLEINKIVASLLLAGVIAMTAGLIANLMTGHHALDAPVYLAAATSTGAAEAVEEAPAGPEPILALLAEADVGAGETVAKKCTACHTFDEGGANKVGPNLWDIVGAQVAANGAFAYSDALLERAADVWSYDNLNAFLAKPKDWAPGTKMSFAGLRKAGDRAAIVAYMRSKSASPAPLPSPEELSEATPAEAESMVETVVEAVQEAAESAGEMAEEAAESATEMAEEAAATVGAAAQAAGEAAEETMQSATEAVQEATTATEAATQPAAADGGGSGFAAQVASAEPALAKKVSRKCTACHTFEQGGKNKIGPNLYGVIGRNVAALDSFKYSNALKDRAGETWTYENLLAFLTKPKDWAPGNKMTFAGLRKEADRAAIIAFMRTYHDDPPALPE